MGEMQGNGRAVILRTAADHHGWKRAGYWLCRLNRCRMPGKSQSYSDAVLNVLRETSITGVSPYLGLFSVAPADDSSAGTELAGNGYARQAIVFGAPVTDTGNLRKISNRNKEMLWLFSPCYSGWAG